MKKFLTLALTAVMALSLLTTLEVSLAGLGIGFVIGIGVCTLRLSPDPLLRRLGGAYIFVFRGVPLLVQLLAGKSVDVPVLDMLLSLLKIVLIPVVIGVLANVWLHSLTARLEPLLPLVSMVAIVLIIATVVALNAGQFAAIGPIVALAVILHNGIGITAGYWVSRWLGFDERICRTIAFEVGLQNSGLATALAMKFFTPASAVAGTLFSVWHNLSGSLLAGFWARRPLLLAERQTGAAVKDH